MSGSNPGNLPQFPGDQDTRPASLDRSGMMRRWVVPTATIGGFTTTGTGTQQRLGVALATASVAGAMTAADFAKLAGMQRAVGRLSYVANTDLLNGAALTATTATDVHTNQSFTVASASAQLLVLVRAAILVTATATFQVQVQALFNSAGTPVPIKLESGVGLANEFSVQGVAAFLMESLPTGTNTIKLRVICSQNATAYCRANTLPLYEWLELQIFEIAP